MSAPEPEKDFYFDLYASGKSSRPQLYLYSTIAAVLFLTGIVLSATTNFAAWLLPMDDAYLQILVPPAPDGAEPLSLKLVTHEVTDKTLAVRGSVENRTDQPINELHAVIAAMDTTGRFGQTVEVPVTPTELPPHSIANFEMSVTLREKPISYSVKFTLPDGPFLRHKDERPYQLSPF